MWENKSASIWWWPHFTATHPSAQQTSWQELSLEVVEREQHLAVGDQLNWTDLTFLVPFTSNYIWSVGTALADCLFPLMWKPQTSPPSSSSLPVRKNQRHTFRLREHLTPCRRTEQHGEDAKMSDTWREASSAPHFNQSKECLPIL